jgi:hypothetical protein
MCAGLAGHAGAAGGVASMPTIVKRGRDMRQDELIVILVASVHSLRLTEGPSAFNKLR